MKLKFKVKFDKPKYYRENWPKTIPVVSRLLKLIKPKKTVDFHPRLLNFSKLFDFMEGKEVGIVVIVCSSYPIIIGSSG